jgi:hypothetical protein
MITNNIEGGDIEVKFDRNVPQDPTAVWSKIICSVKISQGILVVP